jgi:hypothetical protein
MKGEHGIIKKKSVFKLSSILIIVTVLLLSTLFSGCITEGFEPVDGCIYETTAIITYHPEVVTSNDFITTDDGRIFDAGYFNGKFKSLSSHNVTFSYGMKPDCTYRVIDIIQDHGYICSQVENSCCSRPYNPPKVNQSMINGEENGCANEVIC